MSNAEYDGIADVYDETRRPLHQETQRRLVAILREHGCRSVLEIGVGTGRVSLPLLDAGLVMTGVDVSRRMIERARSKGLQSLILASGTATPFKDGCFDGALLAHIIHLVGSPESLLQEGARVSREGVFALLRKRDGDGTWFGTDSFLEMRPSTDAEESRKKFREIANRYNWSCDMKGVRNWHREGDVLQEFPPDELTVVSDVVVTEAFEDRIARFEKGAYSFVREMPPEMRGEVASEMRQRALAGNRTGSRREVYQLAYWRSESLRP